MHEFKNGSLKNALEMKIKEVSLKIYLIQS